MQQQQAQQQAQLQKQIVVEGQGEPIGAGRKAIVHYTGKFLDGRVFDSSVSRGQPFEFNVGQGQVIRGWDIGVASMKLGEKCLLLCPPEYAYGAQQVGQIPSFSTLLFEVELLGVQ
jgi:FK506-binding protein 4/5